MLDDLRTALRRSIAPATLLVALLVALLETATGFGAALAVLAIDPYLPAIPVLRRVLRDFLLPFILWLPIASFALAGFFTVLHEPRASVRRSLLTFVRGGRRHFRRYLTAAVAGAMVSLAVLLAVWLLLFVGFLAASTGFDYYRYARGARFAANPLYALVFGGALFAIAGVVTGSLFAYIGPLVVQTDEPAWRLPLASLAFTRQHPRRAFPVAVVATLLLALPPHLGRTVLDSMRPNSGWLGPPPDVYRAQLLGALAVALLVATLAAVFARALTGPLLVHVAEDHTETPGPTSRPGLAALRPWLAVLRPGRRFTAMAVVLLLVGTASAGVRMADIHPQNNPEPGIDLTQSPGEIYAASVSLTEDSSRRENYSTITRHPNGSLERRVTWRVAWDPVDAQLFVSLGGRGNGTTGESTTYMGEGVLARRTVGEFIPGWSPDQFKGLYRVQDGWIVLPVPGHGMTGGGDVSGRLGRYHTNQSATLQVSKRTDEQLVLTASGSDAAALSEFAPSPRRDLQNATFRAVIDPRTGYLQRVHLRGTLVKQNEAGTVIDRTPYTVSATFRDVGETDVTRPNIGSPSSLEVVWDVLHY